MHELFRQYAQQMGLQRGRGIASDQIDLLLNDAILSIANESLNKSISDSNTGLSKVNQINSLKTLYKVDYINLIGVLPSSSPFNYNEDDSETGKLISNTSYPFPDNLFLIDFSINYCKASKGWGNNTLPIIATDKNKTKDYPARIIAETELSSTLFDEMLKPVPVSPIVVIRSENSKTAFDLYIGKFSKEGYVNTNYVPYQLRISYITKPVKVRLDETNPNNSVSCNLPEYRHGDVVRLGVDLYSSSISKSNITNQQS